MSFEFFIALAIIIGLSELKEWRAFKRQSELKFRVSSLDIAIEQIQLDTEVVKKSVEDLLKAHPLVLEDLNRIRETIEKTESQTATILKEYELNGIPLGYQRRNPDFIEGL